ncbi:MAG: hypothetical protein EKK64_00625 [Neisseriaceae bacterium]|nr:MAG: hypothetical protein EKK64_00625 [Neisseriaceae bacterium]
MNRREKINSCVDRVTTHMFCCFLNPKNRGSNFNFEKFVVDVIELSVMGCENSFVKKMSLDDLEYCKDLAKTKWEYLLKTSDVTSWISSQKGV